MHFPVFKTDTILPQEVMVPTWSSPVGTWWSTGLGLQVGSKAGLKPGLVLQV